MASAWLRIFGYWLLDSRLKDFNYAKGFDGICEGCCCDFAD